MLLQDPVKKLGYLKSIEIDLIDCNGIIISGCRRPTASPTGTGRWTTPAGRSAERRTARRSSTTSSTRKTDSRLRPSSTPSPKMNSEKTVCQILLLPQTTCLLLQISSLFQLKLIITFRGKIDLGQELNGNFLLFNCVFDFLLPIVIT